MSCGLQDIMNRFENWYYYEDDYDDDDPALIQRTDVIVERDNDEEDNGDRIELLLLVSKLLDQKDKDDKLYDVKLPSDRIITLEGWKQLIDNLVVFPYINYFFYQVLDRIYYLLQLYHKLLN